MDQKQTLVLWFLICEIKELDHIVSMVRSVSDLTSLVWMLRKWVCALLMWLWSNQAAILSFNSEPYLYNNAILRKNTNLNIENIVFNCRFKLQTAWIQIQAPPFPVCVILGISLNLSMLQFPYVEKKHLVTIPVPQRFEN